MVGGSDDPTRTSESTISPPTRAITERPAATLRVRDRSRYDVLAEHGRGGLGRVSRAHDKDLGRDVAIKELIKRGDHREIRFVREALITARLEHPGIVPVHEAGCWSDGTPFYAMKLVSGRSLKELIEERSTIEARLELLPQVIAVADAIAYAHGRRIIHRDLKPANVIVGEFGETVVIDWGLAKDVSEIDQASLDGPYRTAASSELTATGSVLGTPAYMAPEQARGEPVDERVDVFAIGALLWELCTHTRVEPGDASLRLLRREGVDQDLATIVAKALSPDPRDRYPTAAELAVDLKAFQAGARIASRTYSLPAMLAHWARRQRRLAISAAAAAAIALVCVIWFVRNIAAERDRADASASEAQAQQRRAEQIADRLTLRHAELQLRSDPTAAIATLDGYRGSDRSQLLRLRAEAIGRGVAVATMRPHSNLINFLTSDASGAILSVSRDRTLRLTRGNSSTTLASDLAIPVAAAYARDANLFAYAVAHSGIALLDPSTGTTTKVDAQAPYAIDLLPDGSKMAAVSAAGPVTVWSLTPAPAVLVRGVMPGARDIKFAGPDSIIVRTDDALRRVWLDAPHRPGVLARSLRSFDANGRRIVCGDSSGSVAVLSPELAVLSTISPCRKAVASVTLVPRGDAIAFACEDGTVGVATYDDAAAKIVAVDSFVLPDRARRVLADATGTQLVVSVESSSVYVYDLLTRLVTRYDGQPSQVLSIAAPTATFPRILVGDSTGHVRVWGPPRRDARILLKASSAVFGVEFSPDGASVVAGTADGTISVVRVADGAITDVRGHGDSVLRVRYSDDGRSLVSWSGDRTVRVWRADTGAPLRVFTEHRAISEAAAFIDSGRRIVSIGDDGRLLAWSPEGSDVDVLYARPQPLTALEVLSSNGHMIVKDGSSAVWDVAPSGASRQVRGSDGAAVTVLRASPAGRLLAIGTDRGTVEVFNTSDGSLVKTVLVSGAVRQIKFDPEDRDLMIASTDGHVRAVALSAARTLRWHDLPISVRNLDYAPDGETVAFVGNNGGSWFYEFASDTWAFTMDHASEVLMGVFSPDGRLFVSGDRRGTVTLRDVTATLQAARP